MSRRSVRFLTRSGCFLCDEAHRKLSTVASLLRVEVEVVDIRNDVDLEDEYHLRIPVILDADGVVRVEGEIGWRQAIKAILSA